MFFFIRIWSNPDGSGTLSSVHNVACYIYRKVGETCEVFCSTPESNRSLRISAHDWINTRYDYRLSLQTNIFFVCYRSKSRRTLDSDPDPGKNYTFPGLWKLFKNFFTFHLWIHFKNSNSYYESTETTDVYYILIGTFFIKHVLRISPPT